MVKVLGCLITLMCGAVYSLSGVLGLIWYGLWILVPVDGLTLREFVTRWGVVMGFSTLSYFGIFGGLAGLGDLSHARRALRIVGGFQAVVLFLMFLHVAIRFGSGRGLAMAAGLFLLPAVVIVGGGFLISPRKHEGPRSGAETETSSER